MRHPRIVIAGLGLAVLATAGGITAASAGASSTSAHSSPAAVRTASLTVGGKTETVLVNANGLPLYYYQPDTATKSLVSGSLATLWPPLVSASATGTGVSGKVTVLSDSHGDQVTYNGHPLYTYVGDSAPGQAKGNGLNLSGGVWHEVTVAGAAAPAPGSSSSSGGGGYY